MKDMIVIFSHTLGNKLEPMLDQVVVHQSKNSYVLRIGDVLLRSSILELRGPY